MNTPFSDKLRLALKMLSLSSAKLAAELGADKSAVSRWLKGSVQPSAHNLSQLSELIARRVEGFRTLDWERDPQDFAEMFGAHPETANRAIDTARANRGLPIAIWDQMTSTTKLRGKSYEGFFRSTRPHPAIPGRFMHDHGMIRQDDIGLLRLTMGTAGTVVDGWMISLHGQLYCIAADVTGGTLLFGIFNGIGASQVDVFDGVALLPGSDMGYAPISTAMLCERVGDLTGDRDADDCRFAELVAQDPLAPEDSVPGPVQKHLLRDIGPVKLNIAADVLRSLPLGLHNARTVKTVVTCKSKA